MIIVFKNSYQAKIESNTLKVHTFCSIGNWHRCTEWTFQGLSGQKQIWGLHIPYSRQGSKYLPLGYHLLFEHLKKEEKKKHKLSYKPAKNQIDIKCIGFFLKNIIYISTYQYTAKAKLRARYSTKTISKKYFRGF